jgi:RNA 2',3'-cyclic 3'-phosphodiesterase
VSDGAAPARQRLFVAVEVPPAVRRWLQPVQEALVAGAPELRPTRPDGWHLTLAFLGMVDADRVDEVGGVLREVVRGSGGGRDGTVGLSLGAPGRFGSGVVWVGVDDDPWGWLAELGERVQGALAARDLPVTPQPVRPHVTLARGGRGRPVRARHLEVVEAALTEATGAWRRAGGAARAGGDPASSWEVDEVQLWRSHLGRGPARYEVVAAVPLGG